MSLRFYTSLAVAAWLTSAAAAVLAAASPQAAAATPPAASVDAVVKQYCVTCHNARTRTAELSLENLSAADIPANAEVWERVVRKLERHAMPPQGVRRPDDATYQTVLHTMEEALDRDATQHPYPGQPLPHRMNRAEYANAIRDLLDLDLGDVSTLLPPDD